MKRCSIDTGIPTLAVALSEHMNADELRELASLTGGPAPTRKTALADLIAKHLEGTRLRTAWRSLDELQKAAVDPSSIKPSKQEGQAATGFEPSSGPSAAIGPRTAGAPPT